MTRREWTKMRRTHAPRPLPASYADDIPNRTPIVGDLVRLLTGAGIEIWPLMASSMLKRGEVVMYETYED